ncbi:LysM peptidoglycan-binding domain-containing protein [Yangia mangrovi]|uniref:LysM peptidoglycan-binding domain-containing protein n=1 Tax=Alloyangia mangrovi TaxID=1779329 RepID=A0ABT2KGY6_9RHOB|nr:LysM peptidoglycan-binding domain-containing protein [Alloyangia mangrovi]MCT4369615.1 LysM peptidoglycan-binding domain-containing protein [Alloyangia mangrovi]
MNEKLWVWIGVGAAAVVGALYVSGVIGLKPTEVSLPAATPVTEQPAAAKLGDSAPAADAPATVPAPTAEASASVSEGEAETAAPAETAEAEGAEPNTPEEELAMVAPAEGEATAEDTPNTDTPSASADAVASPAVPTFDLVRAEPGGLVTVAGRAEPGSEVVLLLDGKEELSSPVGGDGRFAAFFDLPAATEPQVLRLLMRWNGKEIESEQEVILTPPAPPLVAEEGAQTGEGRELAAAGSGASQEQAAPTVLLQDAGGVEVMQSAQAMAPGGVAIDAITYDAEGGVALSGRGSGEAFLRVYLDNSEVTTLQVAANGRWQVALPQIAAGTYTLRVDQIGGDGKVSARAESPFRREPPEKLAAAAAELPGAEEITAVTVQPGNTLWAIARERYGDGMAYVRLFEANKTQIRDPDLIYPGQIFAFPE